MSISKIRENARKALSGKWGRGALITLAYLAFFFVVGLVVALLGEESIIGSLVDLASSIIQVPLVLGVSYSFIKLKRNEEVKAFDYLTLGFSNFGRAWGIGLRSLLKLVKPVLCAIGSIVLVVVSSGIAVNSALLADGDKGLALVCLILMLVGMVAYIVSLVYLVIKSLLYSLTTYIAYDNPDMTTSEIVDKSAQMMKGNRGKLFVLELSFIGWAILAVISLCIGYLWLLPYMEVALICFYEYLLGKSENTYSVDNVTENADTITEM